MSIAYRRLELDGRDAELVLALAGDVFTDASGFRARRRWQIDQNPARNQCRVFGAMSGERLVAATTRLPVRLRLDGTLVDAAFSVDSMVHPDFRQRGLMRRLYEMAAETTPVSLSKGALPAMQALLRGMGYRPLLPDTYMKTVLAPLRWLVGRFGHAVSAAFAPHDHRRDPDWEAVTEFSAEFDAFAERVTDQYPCAAAKSSAYMTWRYLAVPFPRYRAFLRRSGGRVVCVLVVSASSWGARIVELLWDHAEPGEPERAIRFARQYLRRSGFAMLACWATLAELRAALQRCGFSVRNDRLPFLVHPDAAPLVAIADRGMAHFVDGESDSEYLSR